jgi:hypothetical protein
MPFAIRAWPRMKYTNVPEGVRHGNVALWMGHQLMLLPGTVTITGSFSQGLSFFKDQ